VSCRFPTRFLSIASFRRARAERRPAIDDDECAHFLARLTAAYPRSPRHLILNCDESNWQLVMASRDVDGPEPAQQPIEQSDRSGLLSRREAVRNPSEMLHHIQGFLFGVDQPYFVDCR
jgi:hypothetical protein